MPSTAIFLLLVLAALVAWEILSFFHPKVPSISGTIWYFTIDRGIDGAPIIFLMGFVMGHFTAPPTYEGTGFRLISLSLSVAIIAIEAISAHWKTRSLSRYLFKTLRPLGPKLAASGTFFGGFVVAIGVFSR